MGGTSGDSGEGITVDNSGNVYSTGWFSGTADFDPGPRIYNLASAGAYDIFIVHLSRSSFPWPMFLPAITGKTSQEH